MSWYGPWRPYVPVAKRRAKAAAYAARLAKKEKRTLCPVKIAGRKIASSFWGQAWCDNLERYSDFANRLPRGRTYARNGSVIDLQIDRGKIKSIVSGSEIYRIEIEITVLKKGLWNRLKRECSNSIDSLLDLLRGRFEQGVMQRLTQPADGLFPHPKEIKMRCSCPDWAGLCKHVAATLYGVGARLDAAPELLFTLRGVDHLELIGEAVRTTNLERALGTTTGATLGNAELSEMFGIDIEPGTNGDSASNNARENRRRKAVVPKTRNRQSSADPQPTRPKKNTLREATSRDAWLEHGSEKRPAAKTASTKRALAAARKTNKRKPAAAIATATTKRSQVAAAKKRPKAR
ncbi:MAG: hypothetical protein L0228_05325 [Planctomycetes bacterium]|nr:hypothetical protein [Planctomycetota bacterium]